MKQNINKLRIVIYTLIPIMLFLELIVWRGGFLLLFSEYYYNEMWKIGWLAGIGILFILLGIFFRCWLLNRAKSSKTENITVLLIIVILFAMNIIHIVQFLRMRLIVF